MNRTTLLFTFASFLFTISSTAPACEYKFGETKFLDYATCRYGDDSIQVVSLPENSAWEECIYYLQPFRPPKLLAVTKQKDGKELASINDRSQIGNPCYLTKRYCDAALKALEQ